MSMEAFIRENVDLQVISGKSLSGEAHFFEEVTTPAKLKQLLDSFQEADKLKGMKQLLAMLSKGRPIPEFFPDVVKNVVVKSIELKKMVYIYLVHYADFNSSCREIALLSINTFQKDMSGSNALIRGLALRVMTSIRVPDIIQIQLLAARKCAADTSPYVRKCAANALPKIYNWDREQLEHLQQIMEKLLNDTSTMVLGSTVAAFNEICPNSFHILHQSYRKLCHLLADMDEWTQVIVLEVMTRYIRNQFTDPSPGVAVAARIQAKQRSTAAVKGRTNPIKRRVIKKAFYSDEEDESDEEIIDDPAPEVGLYVDKTHVGADDDLDPDHRLILKSSLPLLKSRNTGVVLAVCSLHHYCGILDSTTTQQIGKALVRILRNHREVQYVVLNSINALARDRPQMFRPFLSEFFVKSTDPIFNRILKLEILTSICEKDNIQRILKELQLYIKDSNTEFVCTTVGAVGRVADADPTVSDTCMSGIMHLLLCTKSPKIISKCSIVLRQLLQQNTQSSASAKILKQLVKLLVMDNGIDEPTARSNVVWLVGEFHESIPKLSGDILRIMATKFIEESTDTKMQIMNFAIKLAQHCPEDDKIQALMTYILEMSRYDVNTDLRDRARLMTAIMGLAPTSEEVGEADADALDEEALAELAEHGKGIMLAPKLPPVTLLGSVDVEGLPNFAIGSLSSVVGHYVTGYETIPQWAEFQQDSAVREAVKVDMQISSNSLKNEIDFKEFSERKGISSSSSSSNSRSSSDSDDSNTSDNSSGSDVDSDESDSESSSGSSSAGSSDSDSDKSNSIGSFKRGSSDSSNSTSSSDSEERFRQRERRQKDRSPLSKSSARVTSSSKLPSLSNISSTETTVTRQPIRKVLTASHKNKSVFDTGNQVPLISSSPNILDTQLDTTTDNLLGLSINSPKSSELMADFLSESTLPIASPAEDKVASILSSFELSASAPKPQNTMQQALTNEASPNVPVPTESLINKEELSEEKILLRPEMGGGLSVSSVFRRSVSAVAYAGAACIFLILRNKKDYNIRRIRITFPSDIRRTSVPEIPVLAPSQEIFIPVEIVLLNLSTKQIKVDIRSDQGGFVGLFIINDWDLMTAVHMASSEFEASRDRLRGFRELSKTYPLASFNLQDSENIELELIKRVRGELNMYLSQGAGLGEVMLVGAIKKGFVEEKVLVTIFTNESDGNLTLRLNCDDAVFCSALHDEVKKILARRRV